VSKKTGHRPITIMRCGNDLRIGNLSIDLDASKAWGSMLLLVLGIIAYHQLSSWWTSRPFESLLAEAKQSCQSASGRWTDTSMDSWRNAVKNHGRNALPGPVLLVRADSGQVHPAFASLDPAVKARNAGDVKVLACLEEVQTQTGTYTDGAAAYTITWRVRLFERNGQQLIGSAEFTGDPPPGVKSSAGPRSGRAPEQEVLWWVRALSDKPLSDKQQRRLPRSVLDDVPVPIRD